MSAAAKVVATYPGQVELEVDADAWPMLALQVGDRCIVDTAHGDVSTGTVVAERIVRAFIRPSSLNIRVRRPRP